MFKKEPIRRDSMNYGGFDSGYTPRDRDRGRSYNNDYDPSAKQTHQKEDKMSKEDEQNQVEIRHKEIWKFLKSNEYPPNWEDLGSQRGPYEDIEKNGPSDNNFLHWLADKVKGKKVPLDQVLFFEHLIIQRPQMLAEPNEDSQTPLALLIELSPILAFSALNIWVPPELYEDKFSSRQCSGCKSNPTSTTSCRLREIRPAMLEHCARPGTANIDITAKGGNACLLNIIDVEKLEKTNERMKEALIQGIGHVPHCSASASEFPDDCDSTRRFEFFANLLKRKMLSSISSGPGTQDRRLPKLTALKMLWDASSCSENVFLKCHDSRKRSLLHIAVELYSPNEKNEVDHKFVHDIIEILIESCPKSIYSKPDPRVEKTSYDLLKEYEADVEKREARAAELREQRSLESRGLGRTAADRQNGSAVAFPARGNQPSDNRMTHVPAAKEGTEPHSKLHCIRKTKNLMKMICIGGIGVEKTKPEKLKYLYGNRDELQICLNLGETTSRPLGTKYLDVLKQQLGDYEEILESVNLPGAPIRDQSIQSGLGYPSSHGGQQLRNSEFPSSNQAAQKDQYVETFKWLRKQKVKKIFKVQVNEIDDPLHPQIIPHSNYAIRKCLEGFEVETFDWKKYDICSETILRAAPNVRVVHLYSTANTAVLRGWAAADGLVKLKRNFHDANDCRGYEETLKRNLGAELPGIRIKFNYRSGHGSRTNLFNPQMEARYDSSFLHMKQSSWIQQLSLCQKFIYDRIKDISSFPDIKKPEVKVAILDDGISWDFLQNQALIGELQRSIKGKTHRGDSQPFIRDDVNTNHGTEMAACVRSVCPMATLFIQRLDDKMGDSSQSYITSATRAIEDAVSQGVDIISMSWSFAPKVEDEKAIKSFVDAIDDAAKKNIIIMAAIPNKSDPGEQKDRLPASLMRSVIRIGCVGEGNSVPWAPGTDNRFFLFPGAGVHLEHGDHDPHISSTSVSTALAAGFAALMLYFPKVQQAYSAAFLSADEANTWGINTDANKTMAAAFGRLSTNKNGNRSCVNLSSNFIDDTVSLSDENGINTFLTRRCARLFDPSFS
ncbi:hypothetical protein TWF481_009210 [Arthrobotrys musiformis]|uniref:Peptidase S8/S53 domain-containing protein n=1 Tax=Arthrobotrys musiformis TaxID=47236 RepID=A0AAV9W472_9PEZI